MKITSDPHGNKQNHFAAMQEATRNGEDIRSAPSSLGNCSWSYHDDGIKDFVVGNDTCYVNLHNMAVEDEGEVAT